MVKRVATVNSEVDGKSTFNPRDYIHYLEVDFRTYESSITCGISLDECGVENTTNTAGKVTCPHCLEKLNANRNSST